MKGVFYEQGKVYNLLSIEYTLGPRMVSTVSRFSL
jgi:hypothetical protein